jgi:hypothetical protein
MLVGAHDAVVRNTATGRVEIQVWKGRECVYGYAQETNRPSFISARKIMSIIDWISKRSIRQMFTTYFRARAQEASHRDALWAVVRSRFPNEQDRATAFWHTFWRNQSGRKPLLLPGENAEEAELKTLMDVLLHVIGGPNSQEMDFYSQINSIYDKEIKA